MRTIHRVNLGFTTVELLITIVIIGIVMALGLPSLRDFVTSNRLTGNVNSMVGLLNYARSEAIVRNQVVVVCPSSANACVNSTTWAPYEIQAFVDVNANGQYNSGTDVLLKTIPAMDTTGSVFKIDKAASPQVLTFETLGYARATASIKIYTVGTASYSDKYGRTLCITKPGRVQISAYSNTCTTF